MKEKEVLIYEIIERLIEAKRLKLGLVSDIKSIPIRYARLVEVAPMSVETLDSVLTRLLELRIIKIKGLRSGMNIYIRRNLKE